MLDEVKTGFCRTGPFLAAHHYSVDGAIVVLAKAMSGGLIPSAAVLMREDIYKSVYGSLNRSLIHTSKFSENGLAMRVGLAVLDVLEQERLGERSSRLRAYMRRRIAEELSGFKNGPRHSRRRIVFRHQLSSASQSWVATCFRGVRQDAFAEPILDGSAGTCPSRDGSVTSRLEVLWRRLYRMYALSAAAQQGLRPRSLSLSQAVVQQLLIMPFRLLIKHAAKG